MTASQSDGSPTIFERQRPQKKERELGTLEDISTRKKLIRTMPPNTDRPINRAMVVGCAVSTTRNHLKLHEPRRLKILFSKHSCQNAKVVEAFCHAACRLSNQCRPSIHQPPVDEFRMPAEMSIALSRAHLHARMHVASCWRRVHHRDRHQHTIPVALAALPGAILPATSCLGAFWTPASSVRRACRRCRRPKTSTIAEVAVILTCTPQRRFGDTLRGDQAASHQQRFR